MGVRVDYHNLYDEVKNTNAALKEYAETAENSIQALEAYCEESELSGSAYTNSKSFFWGTYIPILEQIKEICGNMVKNNNKILSTFKSIVPTTHGLAADTDVIEAEITRLRNENTDYQSKIASYSTPEAILYSSSMRTYYYRCIWINDSYIKIYKETVDNLYEFDNSCSIIFDDNLDLIAELTVNILELGKAFPEGTTCFTIPESVKKLLEKLEKAEKEKLLNADGSVNYDKLVKLIEKCEDMTQVELRVVWGIMNPSWKKCPRFVTFEKLKEGILKDLTTAGYDNTEPYQKDILIILYENDHDDHAKSMRKFFKNIPEDNEEHAYSDDVRNIKFLTYTADEPYRSFFLSFIGDLKVAGWTAGDTEEDKEAGKGQRYDPNEKVLYLDFTDDVTDEGTTREGANDHRGPYVTFFHECFHAIDDAMVADLFSVTYRTQLKNELLYYKAKVDVEERIMKEIRDLDPDGELSDSYEAILNKIVGPDNSGDGLGIKEAEIYRDATKNIAGYIVDSNEDDNKKTNYSKANGINDVYEGYTNGSITAGIGGHKKGDSNYWYYDGETTYNQKIELWAHYGARVMTGDPDALGNLKEYFPRATEEMDNIMYNYVNGGN